MSCNLAGFRGLAEPEGMSRTVASACTLAVGGLIALQPPANAALARH